MRSLNAELSKAVVSLAIVAVLFAAACGGGDSNAVPSGSGRIRDPYLIDAGRTYDVALVGMRETCGTSFNPSCPTFDQDYVTLKFTVPETAQYKGSFTGVDANDDLVVLFFRADPGSTVFNYAGTLDDNGKGGSETLTETLAGGETWEAFLVSWGGPDTIQVRIEKAN